MHNSTTIWIGLAISTFGLVYGLRKTPLVKRLWARVPDDLRPFAPAALAGSLAAWEALESGRPWRESAALALSAAMAAVLAHHGLKRAPGAYK